MRRIFSTVMNSSSVIGHSLQPSFLPCMKPCHTKSLGVIAIVREISLNIDAAGEGVRHALRKCFDLFRREIIEHTGGKEHQYLHAYPSATSSVIITLKPTAKNTVPRLECFPCDISGISSSTTT